MKGIRFGTLDKLCTLLNCQPGDLLAQIPDDTD
ncbi:helix-turn-helix domain-containing protein [Elstera litoralis]|nr:helix-turn-helix domain-containing protein [Elstera litoralis]